MIRPLIRVVMALTISAMAAATNDDDLSDDELAARVARRGDSAQAMQTGRAAFDRLYTRHAPLLSAFLAARVRRDHRDDLNQEVWRRAWQYLPDQYQGGNFRAWMHQIARNAIVDLGRKKHAEPLVGPESLVDRRGEPPDASLIEHERKTILERCLDALGADAAALVKGRLGGENYEDLCVRLGMKAAKAHKLWHKLKRQLQDCVGRALS